ncbi:hypothetical protein [Bacillus cereus]|uniref:hypothetical protein n=1 Tax=Bacillus cereus TaxID=1396 RepID=UPI001091F6A6|nr:hypothetical protein [Bacillus cereus]
MTETYMGKLICGNYEQYDSLKNFYDVLNHNLNTMENRLDKLIEEDDEQELTILGPYFARNILETTCNALLGRLDPFRIIFVHKIQSSESFEIGVKVKGAINWASDIFGNDDTKSDKLWNHEKDFNKVGRALFGPYYGFIYWNPAYKMLIDDGDYVDEESLTQYRTGIDDPEKFILYLRSKCSSIYSSLSKGIHSELLIKPDIMYDKTTVLDLINETVKMCALLGLISHYIDTSHCKIDTAEAFEHFKSLYIWREEN